MADVIAIDLETTFGLWNEPLVCSIFDGNASEVVSIVDGKFPTKTNINNKCWVGHNLAMFDMPILQKMGYEPSDIWDTMVVEQFLSGGNLSHFPTYAELVKKYCGVDLDKSLRISDWSGPLTPEQIEYCENDVKYLLEIYKAQYEACEALGMLPHLTVFHEAARVWFKDVWEGFPLDTEKRKELQYACDVEYKNLLIKLLDYVPVSTFLKSSYTGVALRTFEEKVKPYNTSLVPLTGKGKPKPEEYDWEKFRDYLRVTGDFDPDIFVNPSAGPFAAKAAKHFNVSLKNYDVKAISEFVEENPEHPFTEFINVVLDLRKVSKIKGTYVSDNDKVYGIAPDGSLKVKPAFSITTTGRLTFSPYAQVPRPDEDDDGGTSFKNKLQALYVPPPGYITLAADYGSMESVAAGIFYRDEFKLKSVVEGFDPYLLLASKVFGFDYSDVSHTKQLKKDKKPLRQAMKAVELARNFGAGVWKVDDMMKTICAKHGLKHVPGQKVIDAWNSLYPNLAAAFDGMKSDISEALGYFSQYDPDKRGPQTRNVIGDLYDSDVLISIGNTFGLQRIDPAHKIADWVRTPQYINFPIQSSCSTVTLLAVILVKQYYPSIIIPTTIHDSLIMFVPKSGINDLSLEDVKDGIIKLMQYAFYLVFNSTISVDAGYTEFGLKGD